MVDKLKENYDNLLKVNNDLKKNINTHYKPGTLKIKLDFAEQLYADIQQELVEFEEILSRNKFDFYSKNSRNLIADIRRVGSFKLEIILKTINKDKQQEQEHTDDIINLSGLFLETPNMALSIKTAAELT